MNDYKMYERTEEEARKQARKSCHILTGEDGEEYIKVSPIKLEELPTYADVMQRHGDEESVSRN